MAKISRARVDMQSGRLDNATFKDYAETLVGGSSGTNTGSSYNVDLSTGNTFNLILSANCTFTFSNPAASGTESSFTMVLKNNGNVPPFGATWPASVAWEGGVTPALTPIPGQYDMFVFTTVDAGGRWFGFVQNSFAPPQTLWAWGANATSGAIGDNTVAPRSLPVQIATSSTNWIAIAGSGDTIATTGFVHALKGDGTLWAWGSNGNGQLGLGNTVNRSSPTQVGTLNNWASIAGGYVYFGAIKNDGTLWTMGKNNLGQLGVGDKANRSSPTQVGTLTNWAKVIVGGFFMMAVKTDGTLWGWGSNGTGGAATVGGYLGLNDRIDRSSPVQVGTLTNWTTTIGGNGHTQAIKTDGTLWSWGSNTGGGLGQNDTIRRSSPTQVGTLTDWAKLGDHYSFGIKTNGTLWAWGSNNQGGLGLNDTFNRSSPTQVGTLTNWAQISDGANSLNFMIKTDGTLWAWGLNTLGATGQNTTSGTLSSPTQIGTGNNWKSVSATGVGAIALRGS